MAHSGEELAAETGGGAGFLQCRDQPLFVLQLSSDVADHAEQAADLTLAMQLHAQLKGAAAIVLVEPDGAFHRRLHPARGGEGAKQVPAVAWMEQCQGLVDVQGELGEAEHGCRRSREDEFVAGRVEHPVTERGEFLGHHEQPVAFAQPGGAFGTQMLGGAAVVDVAQACDDRPVAEGAVAPALPCGSSRGCIGSGRAALLRSCGAGCWFVERARHGWAGELHVGFDPAILPACMTHPETGDGVAGAAGTVDRCREAGTVLGVDPVGQRSSAEGTGGQPEHSIRRA